MNNAQKNKVAIGWILFVPVAAVIQFLTYSGLYRWLCELQLATGGEYSVLFSAVVPTMLLIAPAIIYLRKHAEPAKIPAQPLSKAETERRALRILAVLSLIAATIGIGALLSAWQVPDSSGPSVDVDLAILGDAIPPLGRVRLIGAIDPSHVARKSMSGKVANDNERDLYAPMVISGSAQKGRIFIHQYVSGTVTAPLPDDGDNRFRGVLIEGGLPHDMLRQFARTGIQASDPYYVLMTGREGARENYYVIAGLAAFFGSMAFFPLVIFGIRRAWRR